VGLPGILLALFWILLSAKIGGELAKRVGQPAVLGELLAGVVIGSSVFGLVGRDNVLDLLAQLGAIVLLFEAGITTDYPSFMKVKWWGLAVAAVGVVFPFLFAYLVCLAFGLTLLAAVFIGATLTATSIGITVRIFRDLGKLGSREAQIVIGAAVADDVIGLIILGALVGLVTTGSFSPANIGLLAGLAIVFLFGSLLIGNLAAAPILSLVRQIRVRGFLFVFSFAFCLAMSLGAQAVGLAPIVGAFAAGLILSRTDHREYMASRLQPVAVIFVPIFFVMMGVMVDVKVYNPFDGANYVVLALAGLLFVAAVAGKLLSGLAAGGPRDRLLIGVGMIPRGEVGLIFASYGLVHGVLNGQLYAALLAVVFLTTFVTPPLLKRLLSRSN
jgi:Kef-type K+ transport system membrane component KefB